MQILLRADMARLTQDLNNARRTVSSAMDNIGDSVKKAMGLLATFGIGLGVAELAHQVIDAQREFDKLNAGLITATGSTQNAAKAFAALQAFAASTPFSVAEATEAFIKLRNLGLTPSEASLRSYGNTASAMGKGLNQLIEAVADAATGEFERLKEFGIKSAVTGDQVAFTFKGVTKMVQNNAKDIEGYLKGLGDVDFAGGMERRAATLDGAISNLGDAWAATLRTISSNGIGDAVLGGVLALSGALGDLSAILDAVGGAAHKEGEQVKEAGVLHQTLTAIFETVAVLGTNVFYVLTQVGNEMGGLAAQAVAVAHGDFAGAKAISEQMKTDAEEARKNVDAKTEAILGAAKKQQDAQDKAAAARKSNNTDELAEYAVTLTAEEKRNQAKIAMIATEQRITGVNAESLADLKKLQTALDTGAITQQRYNYLKGKLGEQMYQNSQAGKDEIKQLEKSSAAVKQRADQQAILNTRYQAQIAFLHDTNQLNDVDFITKNGDAEIKALEDQKASQQALLSIANKKHQNQVEQATLAGQIAATQDKIDSKEIENKNKLLKLEHDQYTLAANNVADAVEAAQAQALAQQIALKDQLDQNAALGKTPQQLAAITAARLLDQAARAEGNALLAQDIDWTGKLSAAYTAQAVALRDRSVAVVAGAGADVERAKQLLEILTAVDDAAQTAAQGMANSFGTVGTAIGGLTTALTGYAKTQAAIAAQLAIATNDAGTDPAKIERAKSAAAAQSAQAQIKSYGDMASAAKGFFNSNSKGYKILETTEKAFRAYEMAMAIEAMVKKIFFKEAEVGANVALNATKLTGEAATTAASTGLAATEASAWGITAVVKALASLPFPFNLAAGAATLAAVVAIGASMLGGVGGGGSVSVSEQRQASQGTGTVLGDNSAKSESIKNSLELSAANSSTLIVYTNGMLLALRAIQSSIGGLSTQLVQGGLSGAVTDSSSSGFWSKLGTSIFGGKVTTDDVGISTSVTSVANALMNGLNASKYVQTTTSGGWFSSDKHNTATSSLGDTANAQFQKVISGIVTSVKTAAGLLGINGDDFSNRLNSFVIDIGKISIKDMTGDQIQTALEAAFSKLGDQMAEFSVAGLSSLANVGEGYLETLTRVATDYAKMDASLQSIGMTFGSVGVSSLAAREDLITMMGGIDAMASATADFASNYLTKAQQNAPVLAYVTDQMAKLGLASVTTRDQFAKVVTGLTLSDPASATLYANLMNLEAAFAATHAATVDLTKSEQDIADERSDMESTFDQLTLTSTQLRAKERLSIDASNLALFDQITYLQTIADTSDALKTSVSNLDAFRKSIMAFSSSQLLGSLSPLTAMQKDAEAKSQYEAMLAKANAGDDTARAGIQAAATAFLTADQVVNANSAAYVANFTKVQGDLATLAAITGTQMSDAQAQLDYLDKQVSQLATLNATASGIATALTTSDWSGVGTSDMSPLVDEIKGLRADNDDLRADNAALLVAAKDQTTATNNQTAALTNAVLTAASNNAAAVTAGAQETAAAQTWAQQLLTEVAAK